MPKIEAARTATPQPFQSTGQHRPRLEMPVRGSWINAHTEQAFPVGLKQPTFAPSRWLVLDIRRRLPCARNPATALARSPTNLSTDAPPTLFGAVLWPRLIAWSAFQPARSGAEPFTLSNILRSWDGDLGLTPSDASVLFRTSGFSRPANELPNLWTDCCSEDSRDRRFRLCHLRALRSRAPTKLCPESFASACRCPKLACASPDTCSVFSQAQVYSGA